MLLSGDFNIQQLIYLIVSVIIGFSIHEYAHAVTADLLGDSTPRSQGRLTMSPAAHLDIVGLLMFVIAWFGWAKPVEVNPSNFRSPKRDDIVVSLAGPASNLALAFILTRFYYLDVPAPYMSLLDIMITTNVILAIFNLLPIPPLDGSHVLKNFLPKKALNNWHVFEQYSMIIFILLVISGVTSLIIEYPVNMAYGLVHIGVN
jgi:Zn-dependent protease